VYAIVKTGGKQYRVQEGQSLLIERLPVADGDTVALTPLLFVDGSDVVDGDGLTNVTVQARVLAHERGPKLRIVKFKPKRGYKRRNGHRQELTRIEITSMKLGGRRSKAGAAKTAKEPAPEAKAAKAVKEPASEPKAATSARTTRKPASDPKAATKAEATDGA
jgi:large subunit ribosomal protein L21